MPSSLRRSGSRHGTLRELQRGPTQLSSAISRGLSSVMPETSACNQIRPSSRSGRKSRRPRCRSQQHQRHHRRHAATSQRMCYSAAEKRSHAHAGKQSAGLWRDLLRGLAKTSQAQAGVSSGARTASSPPGPCHWPCRGRTAQHSIALPKPRPASKMGSGDRARRRRWGRHPQREPRWPSPRRQGLVLLGLPRRRE